MSTTPAPDILNLLDSVVFNFLIGNNDAHGKNFSLLYRQNHTKFAPLYDLVSTSIYPDLSSKMAMKVGKKYLPRELKTADWEALWEAANLPQKSAQRRTLRLMQSIESLIKKEPAHSQTSESISREVQMRINLLRKQLA